MVIPAHRIGLGSVRRSVRRAAPASTESVAIPLDDPAATAVTIVGAKAANLAKATSAGLPVLPGFAVPVAAVAQAVDAGGFGRLPAAVLDELHGAWAALSRDGDHAVVARSSAISEDADGSSMAGRFESVLDVRGWRPFVAALDTVAASAAVVALDGSQQIELHDMAILVQAFLPATYGGVLFGADPVSGRLDRFTLATVRGGPHALVSGEDTGAQQVMTRHGRLLATDGNDAVAPGRRRRHELASLARRTAAVFGGPQDVEWAADDGDRLWLLQSRPVTTLEAAPVTGPVLGPGPLAETFPDPLSRLEQDLWLVPLREGIVHAIDLLGAVSRTRLASSPVAVAVGGRLAVDLALIGAIDERSMLNKLDPRPGARRLRAAWRTGRLRRAMPDLGRALIDQVDTELRAVPALRALDDTRLLAVLAGTRRTLVALHGQEVVAGLLLADAGADGGDATGAAHALRALADERRRGVDEDRIVARRPEVLALVPPAIRPATLPPCTASLPGVAPLTERELPLRELLRLRTRWVQELASLVAWETGTRLAARGLLADAEQVRHLDLAGVQGALLHGHRAQPSAVEPAAPLPARFRLDAAGRAVAVKATSDKVGQGAGGGRAVGRVVHDPVAVGGDERVVLVTVSLSPSLAAVLPGLAGLVAETGSVLSHLAILARELGVATVVDVAGARSRFAEGAVVVVDGSTGTVEEVRA